LIAELVTFVVDDVLHFGIAALTRCPVVAVIRCMVKVFVCGLGDTGDVVGRRVGSISADDDRHLLFGL